VAANDFLARFDDLGADVARRAGVLFDWFLDDVAVS
jgi:hypothetical protein